MRLKPLNEELLISANHLLDGPTVRPAPLRGVPSNDHLFLPRNFVTPSSSERLSSSLTLLYSRLTPLFSKQRVHRPMCPRDMGSRASDLNLEIATKVWPSQNKHHIFLKPQVCFPKKLSSRMSCETSLCDSYQGKETSEALVTSRTQRVLHTPLFSEREMTSRNFT